MAAVGVVSAVVARTAVGADNREKRRSDNVIEL